MPQVEQGWNPIQLMRDDSCTDDAIANSVVMNSQQQHPSRVGGLAPDKQRERQPNDCPPSNCKLKFCPSIMGIQEQEKSNDNRKQQQVNLRVANDEFYHSTTPPLTASSIINRSRDFFVFNFKLNFLVELSLRFIINAFRALTEQGNNRRRWRYSECRFVMNIPANTHLLRGGCGIERRRNTQQAAKASTIIETLSNQCYTY